MIVKTKVSVASKQMTLTPEQRSPGRCQSPCVIWWGMRLLKSFKVSGVLCLLVLVCVNNSWFVIYFRYCVDLIFCHVCKVTCVGIQCCSKSDRFFRKPYHKPVIAKVLTKMDGFSIKSGPL